MKVQERLVKLRKETVDIRRTLSWEAGRDLRAVLLHKDEHHRARLEALYEELEERVDAVCREFSAIKSEMGMN